MPRRASERRQRVPQRLQGGAGEGSHVRVPIIAASFDAPLQRHGSIDHDDEKQTTFHRAKVSISNISAYGRRDRKRLMPGTSSTADTCAGVCRTRRRAESEPRFWASELRHRTNRKYKPHFHAADRFGCPYQFWVLARTDHGLRCWAGQSLRGCLTQAMADDLRHIAPNRNLVFPQSSGPEEGVAIPRRQTLTDGSQPLPRVRSTAETLSSDSARCAVSRLPSPA